MRSGVRLSSTADNATLRKPSTSPKNLHILSRYGVLGSDLKVRRYLITTLAFITHTTKLLSTVCQWTRQTPALDGSDDASRTWHC